MIDVLLLVLIGIVVALLTLLVLRKPKDSLEDVLAAIEKGQEKVESSVKDEIARNRDESSSAATKARQELSASVTALADSNARRLMEIADGQKNQLDSFGKQLGGLTDSTERRLETMRTTIEAKLTALQEDNSRKLDQMRTVVDEKLHSTLEKRLGESFNIVVQRLEMVHKGLGEMQSLAAGVGDLKRILSNVKTRGTVAEWQLENMLEQVMAPGQYEKNVATKRGSNERVEFALKLPGQDETGRKEVFLPIDAKFPKEDFERLLDARDKCNPEMIEQMSKQLERRAKEMAKSIRDKYLDPPNTTDFGIMYVPTEGLFAEIVSRPEMCAILQRDFRVMVAGPTTLATLLSCVQVGFKTLAIAQRSSEVWAMLGTVKTEFGKFGDLLEKTKKKLDEASNTIDDAARKSRTIERKLRDVQELPPGAEAVDAVTAVIETPLLFLTESNDTDKNEPENSKAAGAD
ncbi:MAG TPA: DNA recombination protein RmuC [Pyrinomonadaceae bacterium]|nr:DNA recombination protein RmuC [Pyrinomonadaceae bacterium]